MIERIRDRYPGMSEAHRRLADYLVRHFDEAALLTTEGLASRAGVSPATVVRFATDLGYSGFAALQQEMREVLVSRLSPEYRAARLAEQAPGGGPEKVARQALALDRELVDQLLEQWDDETAGRVTRLLVEAERVLVLGFRISAPVARYLTHLLSEVRPRVQFLEGGGGDLPEQTLDLGPGDVVVGIAFGPLYVPTTLHVAAWARQRGARVVGITDSPVSPLARLADVALWCPHRGLQFQFSLVPAIMLVNALVNAVAAGVPQGEGGVKARLATVAALCSRWGLLTPDLPPEHREEESAS